MKNSVSTKGCMQRHRSLEGFLFDLPLALVMQAAAGFPNHSSLSQLRHPCTLHQEKEPASRSLYFMLGGGYDIPQVRHKDTPWEISS